MKQTILISATGRRMKIVKEAIAELETMMAEEYDKSLVKLLRQELQRLKEELAGHRRFIIKKVLED